jgi:hypothetical protein
MKRTLKYGLTTALRSFEEPDTWHSSSPSTTGPIIASNDQYKIVKGTSGDIVLHQIIKQNEELNLKIVIEENCHVNITGYSSKKYSKLCYCSKSISIFACFTKL